MDWLSKEELSGFKSVGDNVLISKHAIIYGPENITIRNNVRIDAGCIILCSYGWLHVGDFVHLAARSTFLCSGGIFLSPFSQVASHNLFLSASDDFSGEHLIGPMVPENLRSVYKKTIYLGPRAVVGASCVLSPGTDLLSGAALGAMSMTKKDQTLKEDTIYFGIPAKEVRKRETKSRDLAYSCKSVADLSDK